MLERRPFKAILPHPGLGPSRPVEVCQVIAILGRFPGSGRTDSPGSRRGGGLAGGSRAVQIQNGVLQGLLMRTAASRVSWVFLHLSRDASVCPAFSKDAGRPGASPPPCHGRNGPTLPSKIEAQRQVGGKKVGGWSESGARGVAASVLFMHCCSKKIAGPLRALPEGDILMS